MTRSTGCSQCRNQPAPRKHQRFAILWRSKERSDAAQTIGSMPRLRSVATCRILLRCTPWLRSRHGSSGLRDGASLLLRPWMTKSRGFGQFFKVVTETASRKRHSRRAFRQLGFIVGLDVDGDAHRGDFGL
ncbi:MAG: hypothetical protein E5Y06_04375 [Mesorhizobium sp.]|nr:MAG: hypothetical protein E5Y06_04375 [Mesorhizobium sp.]TJU98745.1 MAG: hypothetical protein E5Y08_11445 [Mesorhizobium sp.]TJV19131.1 MAG: hypothetical protein E5Y07_03430 [Mesorhizobium sp.]